MTRDEIKVELDKLGVEYKSDDLKDTLETLLEEALAEKDQENQEEQEEQEDIPLTEAELLELSSEEIDDTPVVTITKEEAQAIALAEKERAEKERLEQEEKSRILALQKQAREKFNSYDYSNIRFENGSFVCRGYEFDTAKKAARFNANFNKDSEFERGSIVEVKDDV